MGEILGGDGGDGKDEEGIIGRIGPVEDFEANIPREPGSWRELSKAELLLRLRVFVRPYISRKECEDKAKHYALQVNLQNFPNDAIYKLVRDSNTSERQESPQVYLACYRELVRRNQY